LAWHLSRGIAAIPKSTSEEHQRANLNVRFYLSRRDFFLISLEQLPKLDKEDIGTLGKLNKNTHLCGYPGPKDRVFGWTYEQMGW